MCQANGMGSLLTGAYRRRVPQSGRGHPGDATIQISCRIGRVRGLERGLKGPPDQRAAVIVVCFLVAFYATTLNTHVGVKSIDPDYFRAAACLGASRKDILFDVTRNGQTPQHLRKVCSRPQSGRRILANTNLP
jgi:hypothetical protein